MKEGLLLINLGTPEQPTTAAVRRYLRDFLSDKRVITLPALFRYLLVYGIILPFRAPKTASLYQTIWTEQGSPLLVNSVNLKHKLQVSLGERYHVELGMRYGEPSLSSALEALKPYKKLTILPLYPHYASATTGSSIEDVFSILRNYTVYPSLKLIRDFYTYPAFVEAIAGSIQPFLAQHDYILFSYHGLPESHLHEVGCKPICKNLCSQNKSNPNASCYKAQCQHTTYTVGAKLGLQPHQYGMAFQSQLGKVPWIKPSVDELLLQLSQKNIKRLAVVCPSFTSDCLETLEEIGVRAKETWKKLGGKSLTLIPCLNDNDAWVDALSKLITID